MGVSGICNDEANNLVTTPAYMCATAKFHEVFDGIGNMVNKILHLVDK